MFFYVCLKTRFMFFHCRMHFAVVKNVQYQKKFAQNMLHFSLQTALSFFFCTVFTVNVESDTATQTVN